MWYLYYRRHSLNLLNHPACQEYTAASLLEGGRIRLNTWQQAAVGALLDPRRNDRKTCFPEGFSKDEKLP
ncbi:hypothetical protein JHK85_004042 [Glycine max]|nr:hypothetical protein JHK85_004042 [Glycine max]